MKRKYIELFQNIGIFTLANFAAKIMSFLILPLYTYYLTTAEYGTIDLVNTTIQLVFPILSLSIVDAVMRFGISEEDSKDKIFTTGLNVIVIGMIPLTIICLICILTFDKSYISLFFALIYLVQALNNLFASFAKAINKTAQMAVISTITSLSILTLNVVFIAFLHYGILGYWVSTILGNCIGILLYIVMCQLYKYFTFGFRLVDKKLLGQMLKYSIPLIPNALFWWINTSLDRWVLTAMTSISIVGLYSVANKLPTILSTVNSIFNQAWNLSMFQSNDKEERNSFFSKVYVYYDELMFLLTLLIIVFSPIIAKIMFSKDFASAWIYVPVLTLGVYYNSLNGFIGSLFTAAKDTKYIFTSTLIGSLVNLLLNIPFVFLWGALGSAAATFLSYFFVYIVRVKKVEYMYSIYISKTDSRYKLLVLILVTVLVTINAFWLLTIMIVIGCSIITVIKLKKGLNQGR
ncbi:oligosaccharide flippase family protein [Latilactobacillus sakei]|uniref:oligosaccharide flippase family protein n=1 Tax=Latilactobacillus sakei TaxID=1599 RepID=UPI000C13D9A0|nr:oligosaccharide flippase family protein [Latilactobacillus sakei]SOB39869.1 putative Polysaccharide biosynthesis family protein [Latilactobacillus sakei]